METGVIGQEGPGRTEPGAAGFARATLGALILLGGLGACTTQVTPAPSAAVMEMRAQAAQRAQRAASAACVDPRTQGPEATVIPFGFLEATLDETATRRLSQAAAFAVCAQALPVILTGEADNHGTAAERQTLIDQRTAAMRRYLVGAGVAEARISVAKAMTEAPAGDNAPLVLSGRGRGW